MQYIYSIFVRELDNSREPPSKMHYIYSIQARPRRRPAPAPCKEANGWKDESWLIEHSSGMVNRDSVVMVNRYIFVVVNRNSQLMVNRNSWWWNVILLEETIVEQKDHHISKWLYKCFLIFWIGWFWSTWSNLIDFDQKWSNLIKCDEFWSNLIDVDKNFWSILIVLSILTDQRVAKIF